MQIISTELARLGVDSKNRLGEGPLWHPTEHRLYWTDIEANELWRWDPIADVVDTWSMPGRVGSYAFNRDGSLIIACEKSIYQARWEQESPLDELAKVPAECSFPTHRFNDGKCSPEGRFWVGTMNTQDPEQNPNAWLFRWEGNEELTPLWDGYGIANGLAWSPEGDLLYHIDTTSKTLFRASYDQITGQVSDREEWINFKDEPGMPDGMTSDAEGNLWVAHWGGACVTRWSSDGKKIDRFELPALQPTSLCFGGPELDTLYITSAAEWLSEEQLQRYPYSGGVMVMEVGTRGMPCAMVGRS